MNNKNAQSIVIPEWIVWVQCICFSVLYAVWALPDTILIRHVCLIAGALLSFWVIYQYRLSFFNGRAIPPWLILTLFVWATFHLFFLSNDFAAQYEEYTSIWKRAIIGAIFALGFGKALSNYLEKKDSHPNILWGLMYFGLIAPTLIYILKYVLTHKVAYWGITVPDFWLLYTESAPYYLPKPVYVCFCLPALGVAFSQLAYNFRQDLRLMWVNLIYLTTIPAVLFVFYSENIKNGAIYSIFLFLLFFSMMLFYNFRRHWRVKLVMLGLISVLCMLIIANSFKANNSWETFLVDAKIATDTEAYQYWKYNGTQGYPNNHLGTTVSVTNYERIAWAKVGLKLVSQNPMGYGLIERSFGHLAKIRWEDSRLHQSHSGWIDLTLGIGIPGVLIVFVVTIILLFQLAKPKNKWPQRVNFCMEAYWWILISLVIMWCTTEVSQKVFFDNLIFWLSLVAGAVLIDLPVKTLETSKSRVN